MDISVTLDKRSIEAIEVWQSNLPKSQFNAGLARVVGRTLRSMRRDVVRKAAARTPVKQKFLRRLSNVKIEGRRGILWFITRDWALTRLGRNRRKRGKGGIPYVTGGGVKRLTSSNHKAFLIRGQRGRRSWRIVIRNKQNIIAPFFYNIARIFRVGWREIVYNPERRISKEVHREMRYRLDKIVRKAQGGV